MRQNKAMHAEHAIGGFLKWNNSRACRVMAGVELNRSAVDSLAFLTAQL